MRYLTGRGPTQAVIVTTAVSLATIVVLGLYAARPAQAASVTLVGAGDIAGCSWNDDEATAKLLDNIPSNDFTVFTAGDNAYNSGTLTQYKNCYDPTWGRHKARTRPSPGNHDYNTSGASGYYQYFGAAAGPSGKGYYSYPLGDWHIVVLNSNCENTKVGGCSETDPQAEFLRDDLAAHDTTCTLAYWHHPVFSSGKHGNDPTMEPAFQILYDNNADLVINGHDHDYERFAPQTPSGTLDQSQGIREIVVGTGGAPLRGFATIRDNTERRNAKTHGVLNLTLNADSYSWQFMPVAGKTFSDSGTTSCH
jgi:acid phosphatase type 7